MLNKVMLIGRLGKDPDIKLCGENKDKRICILSVATTEYWRDKNSGDKVEHTEWHRVFFFNEGLIGLVEKLSFSKGSMVYVEGSIKTRTSSEPVPSGSFPKEIKEVAAQKILLLGGRSGNSRNQESPVSDNAGDTETGSKDTSFSERDEEDGVPF